jgi:hypothetical protein
MSLTNCRFYEEKYPEIDSFVMVNVKQVCWSDCGGVASQDEELGSDKEITDRSPKWVLMSSFSSTITSTA